MPTSELVPWSGNSPIILPPNAVAPAEMTRVARQLSAKDRQHIVTAFESGLYEMVATFVWNKALTSLKSQLGKLGSTFISEMLDRPDIADDSPLEQKLTDYEALNLAQELGVIGGTGAFRLRQAFEKLNHFGSLKSEEGEDDTMAVEEAISVLRACVENVLGFERIEAALDFKEFRNSLESRTLSVDQESIEKLLSSPYFFRRASIRMLLSLVKSTAGATLEHALANANVIVPVLWEQLLKPEKYQIGRVYAELISEGRSTAASGIRRVLLKVQGFDFVPEDLRSRSFVKAAHAIIKAHEGTNNFYNEPTPTRALEKMGSVIPIPAFPMCMSATLSVRLGNFYGVSYEAQESALQILKRTSRDRWLYYFNECLPADDRVLYKLQMDKPTARWHQLVKDLNLEETVEDITKKDVQYLIGPPRSSTSRFRTTVERMINAIGYRAKG